MVVTSIAENVTVMLTHTFVTHSGGSCSGGCHIKLQYGNSDGGEFNAAKFNVNYIPYVRS